MGLFYRYVSGNMSLLRSWRFGSGRWCYKYSAPPEPARLVAALAALCLCGDFAFFSTPLNLLISLSWARRSDATFQ